MTYYTETRRWKSLTPQQQRDIMEMFEYVRDNEPLLPMGYLRRHLSGRLGIDPSTVTQSLLLSQFREDVIEFAFYMIHYQLDRPDVPTLDNYLLFMKTEKKLGRNLLDRFKATHPIS